MVGVLDLILYHQNSLLYETPDRRILLDFNGLLSLRIDMLNSSLLRWGGGDF